MFLDCGKELIGYNKIGNQNIKASTVDRFAQTYEARMHGGNGWIPDRNDKHPYLEIDLGSLFLVCGFEVRGCRRSWPTRYRVQVTPEKDYWDSWNYIKVIYMALVACKGLVVVFIIAFGFKT